MKQGTLITKLVIALLFISILIYIVLSAMQNVWNPYKTVMVYSDTLEDSRSVTGWFLRKESLLPPADGLVNFRLDEAERARKGQTIAMVHQDTSALHRQQSIRLLSTELSQLEYALGEDSVSGTALEEQLLSAMSQLRMASSSGDFSHLTSEADTLKRLILRREYLYSEDASESLALTTLSLSKELETLKHASKTQSTAITAAVSGIFSSQVDGYEDIFSPDALQPLTVSGLMGLTKQLPAAEDGAVGKLISSSEWYFAALLDAADADLISKDSTVSVRVASLPDSITMRIAEISLEENGQIAILLASSEYLADTLSLREQSVNIVFSHNEGIRVPKAAIRVLEDGTIGVFTVTGYTAEFKPVTIAAEGEDYYLLTPNPSHNKDKRILRPGNEVILADAEVYDGKVVR